MAHAQIGVLVAKQEDICAAPKQYAAEWTYRNTPEFRQLGETLDKFDAAIGKAPLKAPVTALYRAGKIPSMPAETSFASRCDPHASARYNGSTPAVALERQCIGQVLERRLAWAKTVDAALDASPEVATARRDYDACKQCKDQLMLALCDFDVASGAAYTKVLSSVEKLRAPGANEAFGQMARKHEQWAAGMLQRCQAKRTAAAPTGCWPQDFSTWGNQIDALISAESEKAHFAAERSSAVDRECNVSWQGRQLRRYVTYYRSSNRFVLVEPATNMAGPPIERVSTKYEGQAAVVATGLLVELGRPWVFSSDPETQALNGAGGGMFMNAGQLGRNIVQHNVRFTDASLTKGDYTYIANGGPQVNASINCTPGK